MEHVGIGEDDVPARSYGFSCILRGVAVIGENSDFFGKSFYRLVQFGSLILGKGLGGKKVDGSFGGILQDGIQYRKVVTEGLSGGGGRDDDDVFSLLEHLIGSALVGVELRETLFF